MVQSSLIEITGWLGLILIMLGYYFNAQKKLYCFYIWGIGNTMYFIYAVLTDSMPIAALSIFIIIMNIYGWIKWNKEMD